MRWKDKPKLTYGKIRTVKKFLLLPKKIGGETRWLEVVSYKQKWTRNNEFWVFTSDYWKDIEWID